MDLVFPPRFGADISPIKCQEILSHIPHSILNFVESNGPASVYLSHGTVSTRWYMVADSGNNAIVALPWACDDDESIPPFRAELPPALLATLCEYTLKTDRRRWREGGL